MFFPRHMKWVFEQLGTREVPGKKNNPKIIRWGKNIIAWYRRDEIPWCAILVGNALLAADHEPKHSARAKSYLDWGVGVSRADLQFGDVVILHRGSNPKKGHVAFFVARKGDQLYLAGGNQSNEVNISLYPAKRFAAARRPKEGWNA